MKQTQTYMEIAVHARGQYEECRKIYARLSPSQFPTVEAFHARRLDILAQGASFLETAEHFENRANSMGIG